MYYFVHSLFLHPPVKRFFIEKLFFTYRAYRIVFNIFASLGLIFIYSFSNTINSPVWIDYYLLKIVGIVVMMLGILITYKSFKNYDIKEFIGLTSESTDTLQNDLVVDGYHRFVRHPVYFATIIILVGYFIYAPSWITTIYLSVTFFYLQIGILLEENKLIFKFGKSYVDYKKVVPKLFPWFCK
jgi:protein-S-isoprenylcysteine O-methyltransferase Ste14